MRQSLGLIDLQEFPSGDIIIVVGLRQIGLNPGAGRYENSSQFAAALQFSKLRRRSDRA